jgi:hypothetical protein
VPSAFAVNTLPPLVLYQFIGEDFIVCMVPFFAIISTEDGHAKLILLGVSLVALASIMVDSLLPYYSLPVSPWIRGTLTHLLSLAGPYTVSSSGQISKSYSIGKVALALFALSSSTLYTLLLFSVVGKVSHIVVKVNDA